MQATRRLTITGLSLAAAALAAPAVRAMPESFAPLVRRVAPAIVGIIVTEYAGPRPRRPVLPPGPLVPKGSASQKLPSSETTPQPVLQDAGSGFIIAPSGLIVTNNHVVGNASRITVTLNDGRHFAARLIGSDELTDLAVIQIEAGQVLPHLRWGNSDAMQVGDWILAGGNPFDLGPSFTAGIIAARGRDLQEGPFDHFLQLDAAINPGDSGGPTFNMKGQVIGVNTAIVSPSGGSVGIGFAIPSNMAAPITTLLIRDGAVPRGWLGIAVGDLPEGVPGVAVTGVEAESPAARADLQPGDIVRAVNNRAVADGAALVRAIASVAPGTVERLTVVRNQKIFTLPVVVGRRPAELGSD